MRPIRMRGPSSAIYAEGLTGELSADAAAAPPSTYLPFAFVDGAWVLAGSQPYYAGLAGADAPPACFA